MSQLVVANIVGIVLSILTAPLVARLYTPAAVGKFALFAAFVSILTPLLTFRYETAVMLPKSDHESAAVYRLVEVVVSVSTLFFLIVALLCPKSLFAMIGVESLYRWRLAGVIGALGMAIVVATTGRLNRQERYGFLATSRVLQNFAYAATVLGFGWIGFEHGQIVGLVVTTLAMAVWLRSSLHLETRLLTWRQINDLATQYRNAPRYLLPTSFLDVATQQIPIVLLTAWFSAEAAGQFSTAWRLLFIPLSLLGGAVGQVFFQKFSAVWPDRRAARRLLFGTWSVMAAVGLIPCVAILMFGPQLFAWGLGERWREAGSMAAIIAPMSFLVLISSPTSTVLIVLNLQKYSLVFGIVVLVYRPLCFWIGYRFDNVNLALALFCVAESVQLALYNLLLVVRTRTR